MNNHTLPRFQTTALILGAWLLISTMQTVHFYYYFEQSLWDSVRWSFRDWFVWFAIFIIVYQLIGRRIEFEKPTVRTGLTIALIAIISGLLQVLIITSMDFLQGTATRPFWEDFWRFYNKRWFQYLFVFMVFWLLMSLTLSKRVKARTNDTTIRVDDGKQTHWLKPSDILSVEAAGNYVCIHHDSTQIIVRGTIKEFQGRLDDDAFLRVSRSNLVNLSAVIACRRAGRNRLELELNNGATISIGPTYKQAVKEKLQLS